MLKAPLQEIGRFLSADPHIQAPYDTQSYNRYTYVKNNPLKYTDPSGFFLKGLIKKIKKWIKPIVAIVAAIYTGGLALAYMGYASIGAAISAGAWGAVMASAAIGGFVSGAIMTGTLKGAVTSAAFAAISAGVAYGIGHGPGILESLRNAGNGAGRYIMHGISRAAITKAQGGRWSSGFLSGLLSSASGSFRDVITKGNYYANVAFSSIVGGTVSEISGGKFANGAVSGAFIYMFNDALEFNGKEVKHYDDNGNLIGRYPASSGIDGETDSSLKNKGPIQEGSYRINPKQITQAGLMRQVGRFLLGYGDWGEYRVPLKILSVDTSFGRSGYYLHNGWFKGSAGCIDIGTNTELFENIKSHDGLIHVTVKY